MAQLNITIGSQTCVFDPNFAIIDQIESEFGGLSAVLDQIKMRQMSLKEQRDFLTLIFKSKDVEITTADFEMTVQQKGALEITKICIEIIGFCLMGMQAIDDLSLEVPSLGKS